MFRIKSDDQRAKTAKRIRVFQQDIERVAHEKGKTAAAWFEKTYRSQIEEYRQQLARYDKLRKEGAGPFVGSDLLGLGAHLVDARIAAGMTQKELAKKLGVSQPMVFKYENAEYRDCSLEVLGKVIRSLKLDIDISAWIASEPSDRQSWMSVSADPGVASGALVFRGTRVPVESLIDNLESGLTLDEFLHNFPSVKREDAVGVLEFTKSTLLRFAH